MKRLVHRTLFLFLALAFTGAVASLFAPRAEALQGVAAVTAVQETAAPAQTEHRPGGEVNIHLPDLNQGDFFGMTGHTILLFGLVVCVLGLLFGLASYTAVKKLPVHSSMAEVSELIFQTCKAYLIQQGKFLLILFAFIGAIIVAYFMLTGLDLPKIAIILLFGLIGMGGSYGVAAYGIRINTLANSRTAFASLAGKAYPVCEIPLRAGMSVGMMLISVELLFMLSILLFIPSDVAGACFLGFAIGESLGASALRIAGGIFTKIADIGSDLMKVVFKIKEDDARNPGVIADCTGDNAGDSVGPTADGFETYGVTGVALISFIVLAVTEPAIQSTLLVWIFLMRIMMVIASGLSYMVSNAVSRSRFASATKMNFEIPLTQLVWVTSIVSVILTYILSYLTIPTLGGNSDLWWQLSTVITCGTLAGAIIPELVKVFTSMHSHHVREVVKSSQEGGASLNILSGLVAGNFSAYWLGMAIMGLMAIAAWVSTMGLGALMSAPAIFAFGLVAFGFLGMGPVTIAVDSYGPVTDNAQSIYELSMIETIPGIEGEVKKDFGFSPNFTVAKELLEENDGAGNTFKATAKPVLIGTAVVGATTMIFSIIMALTGGLTSGIEKLSILHPPFLLGLLTGGAMIYWFTGASMQAVTTGAYRAVEFIKRNIRLEGVTKASVEDSTKVVEICTKYAQKGMFNIFLAVFFATLAFAFVEPFFFIGYLISIALFGLFQAIFMANAGGAWDNAKKIVETELKMKGTELHDASIVGDTVGDPFKDTSSVAMNPVIKFTTLFGLLAVELGVYLAAERGAFFSHVLAVVFFVLSMFFVWRSFYGMRIESGSPSPPDRGACVAKGIFARKSVADFEADVSYGGGLKRTLGRWHLTALGVGATIGAGIFATTGTAIVGDPLRPGAGPAIIFSFLLTAIACGFAALCYAEFAAMVPISGSAYTYAYASLGEFLAWIIGWDLIVEYAVGNIGVAIGWSGHFRELMSHFGVQLPAWLSTDYRSAHDAFNAVAAGATDSSMQFLASAWQNAPHVFGLPLIVNLPAAAVVFAITIILVIGIRESANTNNAMVVLKVGIILFFLAVGTFLINPENWNNPATGGFAPNGFKGVSAAAAIIFFAYIGFDAVSTAAEETKNPAKDMPFGIIMSLVICTVLYIALSAVMTGMAPWQTLGTPEPMITALQQAEGPPALLNASRFIIALGAVIAMGSVLLVFQLGQPRIFFSMSRDGLLPKPFSRLHPRFRTPYVGTIITGTFVATFAAFANIAEVVDLTNIGTLFAFVLVSAGVIFLRKSDPDRHRPFRVPGVPFTPIISIVACAYLMFQLPRITWIRFGVWLLLGLVIYFLYGYRNSVLRKRRES